MRCLHRRPRSGWRGGHCLQQRRLRTGGDGPWGWMRSVCKSYRRDASVFQGNATVTAAMIMITM